MLDLCHIAKQEEAGLTKHSSYNYNKSTNNKILGATNVDTKAVSLQRTIGVTLGKEEKRSRSTLSSKDILHRRAEGQ